MEILSGFRVSSLALYQAVLLCLFVAPALIQAKQHGEACENDAECNSASFLECYLDSGSNNKTCLCLGEANIEMIFLNENCVAAADKSCSTEVGGKTCVPNADCKTSGTEAETCQCKDGYSAGYNWSFGSISGFCWASYNTTCNPEDTKDDPTYCDYTIGLFCNSSAGNVCKCEAEGSVYEWYSKFDRCIRLDRRQEECQDDTDCVTPLNPFLDCQETGIEEFPLNCECKGENNGEMYYDTTDAKCLSGAGTACNITTAGPTCIYNSACTDDKVCECNAGFSPEDDHRCYLTWGSACKDGEYDWKEGYCNLNDDLFCEKGENICRCSGEADGYTGWNNRTKTCGPRIGGSCKTPEECPEKASCPADNTFRSCKCLPEYSETKDRYCKRAIGETCVQNPTEDTERCNADERLTCSSAGKCECAEGTVHQKYDSGPSDRCLIPVGGTCDLDNFSSFSRSCIFFAKCVPNKEGDPIGKCQCQEGYGPSSDNTTCRSGAGSLSLANSLLVLVAILVSKMGMHSSV